MAADGSVVFAVELDDKQAQAELNQLSKKIDSLNQKIFSKRQEQIPLIAQAKELGAELDAAKAKLAEMQSGETFYTPNSIKSQEAEVKKLQKEFDGVQDRVEKLGRSIQQDTADLSRLQDRAGELAAQLAGTVNRTGAISEAAKSAGEHMERFLNSFKAIARRVLVFSVITQGLKSMKDMLTASIKTNAEASASVARLKAALLTLAQPIVNVVIPAFTMLVNVIISVITTLARLLSFAFGTTIEQSAEAAEGLYNEQQALNGVGSAAKKAEKNLASFDEINKLTATNAGGGSSTGISPDFSAFKNGLLTGLTFTLDDVLFNWDDLTGEDVLSKIITMLSALCGGIIGWALGGPGGAALGALIGSGIGLLISNLMFDGDGALSQEEILKSVILALGALAGGILGFVLGGVTGAAVGVLLGAAISLLVNDMIFDGDGFLSQDEILKSAITVLSALAGAIIGFVFGGVGGAAIGATIGTGLSLLIMDALFNEDGTLNKDAVLNSVAIALSALMGGIIGFAVGGPAGAAIGAVLGAGIAAKILSLGFENTGITAEKIIIGLVEALVGIAAGLIGFAVGGPAGAAIGCAVGVGLSLIIDKGLNISSGSKQAGYDEGKALGDSVNEGAADALGIHSPSTEFQEIGNYCMQGMTNGITESQYMVLDAFQAVMDNLTLSYQTWQTNFEGGFEAFRASFSTLWTSFWNQMSYNFTVKWNDILTTLQAGVNNAIDALNRLVAAANSLAGLTGKYYSHVGRINVAKVPLPALAQGAVIPPNREFLAVLGDQKQGTNIETPLSTMVQAFRMALSEGGYNSRNEAVLEIDGEAFGRLVYRMNKAESTRIGANLAEV